MRSLILHFALLVIAIISVQSAKFGFLSGLGTFATRKQSGSPSSTGSRGFALLKGFSKADPSVKQRKDNVPSNEKPDNLMGMYQFVRKAAQKVAASVVRIDGEREAIPVLPTSLDQLLPGEVFKVAGSGLIMTSEGYILTNAHVVDQTKKLSVTLANGRTFKATTIQSDELTDLAVLKVETKGFAECKLTPALLGDSSTLHSGDCVVAVGCPVGLDFTVTSGVVSNPKRSAAEVGAHNMKGNFIQTDAALNSGNSGGPLVNDQGEVVGINCMGLTNTQAIGFAIPINRAKEIYEVLKTGKKPAHPYFGLEITSISPDTIRIHNEDPNVPRLWETEGSLINRVVPGSPADRAGVRRNDIIVSVNGATVRRAEDTEDRLATCKPGNNAGLGVVRGEVGTRLELFIKPLDMYDMFAAAQKKLFSQIPGILVKPRV